MDQSLHEMNEKIKNQNQQYLKDLKNGSPVKRNQSSPIKQSAAMKSIEQSLKKIQKNKYLDNAFSSDSDDDVLQPLSIQFPQIIRATDSKVVSPAK